QVAVDVHIPRRSFRFTDETSVVFQRGFVSRYRDVVPVIQRGNINALLRMESLDETLRSERGSSAVGVVHHDDILDSKQVLGDGYGTERVRSASTGNHNREDGGSRSDLVATLVVNNLAGIYFARHGFCHNVRDARRARIVAVDHNGSQWYGLLECFPHLCLNESRLPRK